MTLCRFVESRCNHFRLNASGHIGNLFRTLINEQDYHIDFRMVVGNCIRDGLQEHCLTCLRLGNDESALALSDRCEHIHYTAGHIVVAVSEEVEFLFREKRRKEVERNPVSDEFRRTSVDELDAYQREILVSGLRWLYFSCHGISGLEGVLLDLVL